MRNEQERNLRYDLLHKLRGEYGLYMEEDRQMFIEWFLKIDQQARREGLVIPALEQHFGSPVIPLMPYPIPLPEQEWQNLARQSALVTEAAACLLPLAYWENLNGFADVVNLRLPDKVRKFFSRDLWLELFNKNPLLLAPKVRVDILLGSNMSPELNAATPAGETYHDAFLRIMKNHPNSWINQILQDLDPYQATESVLEAYLRAYADATDNRNPDLICYVEPPGYDEVEGANLIDYWRQRLREKGIEATVEVCSPEEACNLINKRGRRNPPLVIRARHTIFRDSDVQDPFFMELIRRSTTGEIVMANPVSSHLIGLKPGYALLRDIANNPEKYAELLQLQRITPEHLKAIANLVPPTYVYLGHDTLWPNGKLQDLLEIEDSDFYVKPPDKWGGIGVHRYTPGEKLEKGTVIQGSIPHSPRLFPFPTLIAEGLVEKYPPLQNGLIVDGEITWLPFGVSGDTFVLYGRGGPIITRGAPPGNPNNVLSGGRFGIVVPYRK